MVIPINHANGTCSRSIRCVFIGRVASKGDRCLGVRTSESSFSEPHQCGPTYRMCDGVRRGNLPCSYLEQGAVGV